MFDFPTNPTNGQVYQNFYFDSSIGTWRNLGSKNALSSAVTDLRTASPITVASQAARDALYPTPVQGQSVFRTDLGVTQRYYGLYDASSNPGGRSSAGWYNTEKSIGLVPIQPTTVTFASGTGSVNSIGEITFSGVTNINVDSCFTTQFKNYLIIGQVTCSSACDVQTQFRASGTNAATSYYESGFHTSGGLNIYNRNNIANHELLWSSGSGEPGEFLFNIFNPMIAKETNYHSESYCGVSVFLPGRHNLQNLYDGIRFYATAGTMTGNIQVFGFNDK